MKKLINLVGVPLSRAEMKNIGGGRGSGCQIVCCADETPNSCAFPGSMSCVFDSECVIDYDSDADFCQEGVLAKVWCQPN